MLLLWAGQGFGQTKQRPDFSVAGFYPVNNIGREVSSMNVAWRFLKGDVENAHAVGFNDSLWQMVSLPHGLEILPEEASGSINYQGVAWYRKHFSLGSEYSGKKLFLHFEAIMGKSEIWLNGQRLKEHFGGYLPVIVDITDYVNYKGTNIIAVKADNSDDPYYPPGKPQELLDFAYFGGIYRDCWLISHQKTYISDPNYVDNVAGGGLFVSFGNVSEEHSEVFMKLHLINEPANRFSGEVIFELKDSTNKIIAITQERIVISSKSDKVVSAKMILEKPQLWSPESPYLYQMVVTVKEDSGKVADGYMQKIGIRSIEFRGKEGFWLNGKPYPQPLIGANRHQDFALVGNAVPNSMHWRDAKKLRDAGIKVIRNAHYPQDPAFMDACDALGLFVIVNTPGWQFWNEAPIFETRIYQNIRDIVRRDRNHPGVLLWEPVLNETWYPEDFAHNTQETVKEEYPYKYCYTVCDEEARGSDSFPVLYAHPVLSASGKVMEQADTTKSYFTREWGDNVDDWNSHNSPSRVHRSWGEHAMLVQAEHYANPSYPYTSLQTLHQTPRQHVGGCLWHAFDHNRGYHPDPFYGGIMDAYRQPKYSWQMFRSQLSPEERISTTNGGPMVFIAHEVTPFSSPDVQVYSNCDEVRLQVLKKGKVINYVRNRAAIGMQYPIITFKDVWDFMDAKALSMAGHQDEVFMLVEGLIDGKVVVTQKVMPALRPSKLMLWVDDENIPLQADGSDFVTIIAAVTDENGNIKRLNNSELYFQVEGEGRMIGADIHKINPAHVSWGTAPILVQASTRPGKIKIRASFINQGINTPLPATLEINSVKPEVNMLFSATGESLLGKKIIKSYSTQQIIDNQLLMENEKLKQELNKLKLKEVEQQQKEFGEKSTSGEK
jgi:beta-galactosidase